MGTVGTVGTVGKVTTSRAGTGIGLVSELVAGGNVKVVCVIYTNRMHPKQHERRTCMGHLAGVDGSGFTVPRCCARCKQMIEYESSVPYAVR